MMAEEFDEDAAVKQFYVYILASRRNGTLYIGVTSALVARVAQHKAKITGGFTALYGCDRLVYFEVFENAEAAIAREKQLKEWRRGWKTALIEEANKDWLDLYPSIAQ
jgi:putative endonuclease